LVLAVLCQPQSGNEFVSISVYWFIRIKKAFHLTMPFLIGEIFMIGIFSGIIVSVGRGY
jgi:hypothetical protein